MALSILVVSFFALLILGVPISIAIVGSAISSLTISGLPGILVAQRIFVQLDSFTLMAVPIFILAGEVMSESGITKRIVNFASAMVGHLTAGLGQTSILAAMLMAGISGSAAADASALGGMLIPAMKDEGYDTDLAVSIIASSNVIGPIIPPSIMMIIYGSMTGTSIGAMFVGGIIPGVMMGVGLMILTYFIARKRNLPKHPRANLKTIWKSFREAIVALFMPVIIVGGILSGICTPTESGVLAVIYAFAVGFFNGSIKFKDVKRILFNAAKGTVTPMFLIGNAAIFGWLLARYNLPVLAGGLLQSITTNPTMFMIICWAFYLFVGALMEDTAAMIILTPVLAPIAFAYGVDPVQFGVFTVVTLLIGCITPPVGMLLFLTSAIGKINPSRIYRTIIPFCIEEAFVALLIAIIPFLTTGLIKLM